LGAAFFTVDDPPASCKLCVVAYLLKATAAVALAIPLCASPVTAELYNAESATAERSAAWQVVDVDPSGIAEKTWRTLEYDAVANRNWAIDREDVRRHFARTPDEAARIFREQYGPDSMLTRGATTVAIITNAAERSAQVPLEGINSVTRSVSEAGREIPGLRGLPDLKLKSRVDSRHFGISLTTKW